MWVFGQIGVSDSSVSTCDCRHENFMSIGPEPVEGDENLFSSEILQNMLVQKHEAAGNLIGNYDKIIIYTSVDNGCIFLDTVPHNLSKGFSFICICHLRQLQREQSRHLIIKVYPGAFHNIARYPAHISNTEIIRVDNTGHHCEEPPKDEATVHSLKNLCYIALVSAGFRHTDAQFAAMCDFPVPLSLVDEFPQFVPQKLEIVHPARWFRQRHGGPKTASCRPASHKGWPLDGDW
jgi:hypothetical protein